MTTAQPLTTGRLELVPSTPAIAQAAHEDRVALGELLNCAISNRWPPKLVAESLESTADAVCDDPEVGPWSIWYAIDRTQHLLVGNVRFDSPPKADGSVQILYAVADDNYGKGIATEAVTTISEWALDQAGVSTVQAFVDVDNPPGVRVLEKAGFTAKGREGDQFRYELTA